MSFMAKETSVESVLLDDAPCVLVQLNPDQGITVVPAGHALELAEKILMCAQAAIKKQQINAFEKGELPHGP